MKHFAALFTTLDQTTKTTRKVAALAAYFRQASDSDRLWTIALLSGRRPKRGVTTTLLRAWAAEKAGIPLWLFEESYPIVGDLSETIALVLPPATGQSEQSLTHWIECVRDLGQYEVEEKKQIILGAWDSLPATERFLFNKLITGGLRIGVSQKLMTRALSQALDIPEDTLAHRLMGDWTPDTTSFEDLILSDNPEADASKPYPFYLAYQIEDIDQLGAPVDWQAEWKWDGIRGQLVLRAGNHYLWSRGEELITDRFPEFRFLLDFIAPGTVIDGEILAWDHACDQPQSFAALQPRIGRKTVPKRLLRDAPAILYAYDLLEYQGQDQRQTPYDRRRETLAQLLSKLPADAPIRLSKTVPFTDWEDLTRQRQTARARQAEGVMLKRADSPYLSGRKKGDWWKWKVDPLMIDAVMIYAQAGSGRRATLFTDYTFAVWDGDALVPFTKAYSGLTDQEFRQITAWVKKNTLERFGPVRQVTPHHVFEIAFEGIQRSTRHKSGVALRFPRMSRWRHDKPAAEANTLDDLREMLDTYG